MTTGEMTGDKIRELAQQITLVENSGVGSTGLLSSMPTPSAHIVGITGPPGVGKSTSTSALITQLRSEGKSIAVLAVDPSSTFSKGALLGDRIRMQDHALDSGVFIRSLASRGHLGGLTGTIYSVLKVISAAGFDLIIIETVGVGQSEIEIAKMADTSIVIAAPGAGDGIQAAKAGILEIADIFAVNKSDRPGADATVRELKGMLSMASGAQGIPAYETPVIPTIATDGSGFVELSAAIAQHYAYLVDEGLLERKRIGRIRESLLARTMNDLALQAQEIELQQDVAVQCGAGKLSEDEACDLIRNAIRARQ
jgi:LAO/AO transport system kinase